MSEAPERLPASIVIDFTGEELKMIGAACTASGKTFSEFLDSAISQAVSRKVSKTVSMQPTFSERKMPLVGPKGCVHGCLQCEGKH